MIDFSQTPIYSTPRLREQMWKQTRDIGIAEGRVARRCGVPKSKCPPFRIEDMAVNWRLGWRWEDEDITRKTEHAPYALRLTPPRR